VASTRTYEELSAGWGEGRSQAANSAARARTVVHRDLT
jgi:hypothetical protein